MEKCLNITNGDIAAQIMGHGKIPGIILPWRDVLHDGPVPQTADYSEFRRIRAGFIADCGWGKRHEVEHFFVYRDDIVKNIGTFEKVILWFEHDLYDQLQMLQILDRLMMENVGKIPVVLICTDQYLGSFSGETIQSLYDYEQTVTKEQFLLASRSWDAFCDSSPLKWYELLKLDLSPLPYLRSAVLRLLEEYPSCHNGLSRTEEQALSILRDGERQMGKLFSLNQQLEDRIFMGDLSFFLRLTRLMEGDFPLLYYSGKTSQKNFAEREIALTDSGFEVLSGKQNWMDLTVKDWWLGGVHLTPENRWCWDGKKMTLRKI